MASVPKERPVAKPAGTFAAVENSTSPLTIS